VENIETDLEQLVGEGRAGWPAQGSVGLQPGSCFGNVQPARLAIASGSPSVPAKWSSRQVGSATCNPTPAPSGYHTSPGRP
jgi:hypothetical protein